MNKYNAPEKNPTSILKCQGSHRVTPSTLHQMVFLHLRDLWHRNVAILRAASVAAWRLGGGVHSGNGGDGDGDNSGRRNSDARDRMA